MRFFVGPTIFDHVTEDMSCGREEVFGPVLFIKRVADFEEGLAIMNASRFANGSCIFTESGYYAVSSRVARTPAWSASTSASRCRWPSSRSPVTSSRSSATLHVLGMDGVRFFTETKCVTTRWFTEADRAATTVTTWEGTVNREHRARPRAPAAVDPPLQRAIHQGKGGSIPWV